MKTEEKYSFLIVYSSGAGGVGGRSRIVNGGGVRASGFRSRIRSGYEKKKIELYTTN